jgi:hypothetical protein
MRACHKEKRKRLVQLAKKIGITLKRRLLPLEGNHLFHSELAAEAGHKEKRKRLDQLVKKIGIFLPIVRYIFI